jgi:GTP cyclohydrolase IB
MKDIQSAPDSRGIPIDRVGITNLCYPISVMDQDGKLVPTVANISMSVHLPHRFKGTHMSRFLEVLTKHRGEITTRSLPAILRDLRQRLEAESAHIEVSFPHFIEKTAPVSGAKAKVACDCTLQVSCNGSRDDVALRVVVPVKTLCPCSKEISDYGAHNQRGQVTIEVKPRMSTKGWAWIWIEELVETAERSASAPVYALLKRPDERHITMQAYDNPVFVEDLVRNVAMRLKKDTRIVGFTVQAVNQESIHAHDAFARVVWKRSTRGKLESGLRLKRRRGKRAAA